MEVIMKTSQVLPWIIIYILANWYNIERRYKIKFMYVIMRLSRNPEDDIRLSISLII